MSTTVFAELQFWILAIFSIVLPLGIYVGLLKTKSISRFTVLVFGFALVMIAGVDVYLLRGMDRLARLTPSLADDFVFVSELSLALYLLPALFAGVGINVISHVLIRHLTEAEQMFERGHADRRI